MASIGFVSLGCPKALVDSERILTRLRQEGYQISPDYDGADLVIVNTCGFIDSAREESLATIGEAIQENGKVIVTGCLGIHAEKIKQAHPKVLSITGPQQYEQVVDSVIKHVPIIEDHDPFLDLIPPQGIKLTPEHYAYLKISEGCNHKCSFCIIPSMRGKLASRTIDDILDEAQRLKVAGVKEILVISQDTSAYGVDIKYKEVDWNGNQLKSDLQTLCEMLGMMGFWVRLHYVYPYPHIDRLIPLMAAGTILPYLDVPLQHGSQKILKAMKRPAATVDTLNRIKIWREICPEITIRSTFIVGFPGETDDDFNQLLDFIEQAELDRVGCFQYSAVEGARANAYDDQVTADVSESRWHTFMQTQAKISKNKLQAKVDLELDVIIDHVDNDEMVGRSKGDAPEIDGNVIMPPMQECKIGDIVNVQIERSDEYDLWGKVTGMQKSNN
jgi:ribosomal protein S12 methylthiotransferase